MHHVSDSTPTVVSSHVSPPVNVESSHSAAPSLNLITQRPTDALSTTLPTSNSESDPHPPLVASIFTPDVGIGDRGQVGRET
jgi:hypothetical protein